MARIPPERMPGMKSDPVEVLLELLATRSVAGNTDLAVDLVQKRMDGLGAMSEKTNKGSLVVTFPGGGGEALVVAAHVDTLGAMVSSMGEDGTLGFRMVGGYTMNSVEGEYCTVETFGGRLITGTILFRDTSVHAWGREKASAAREQSMMLVRLDEDVSSREGLRELGISVGNFVHFDPRPVSTPSGFVKSRHLDDKAGVAVLIGLAERLAETPPPRKVYLHFTAHEEVGHGGAGLDAPDASEMLVVDMGVAGPGRESSERKVTICAADNSGPYDYGMTKRLIALAEERSIPHAVDTHPFYTSDAAAALRAGMDVRHALVGPGVDASHAMERTHREGIEATLELVAAYCFL